MKITGKTLTRMSQSRSGHTQFGSAAIGSGEESLDNAIARYHSNRIRTMRHLGILRQIPVTPIGATTSADHA